MFGMKMHSFLNKMFWQSIIKHILVLKQDLKKKKREKNLRNQKVSVIICSERGSSALLLIFFLFQRMWTQHSNLFQFPVSVCTKIFFLWKFDEQCPDVQKRELMLTNDWSAVPTRLPATRPMHGTSPAMTAAVCDAYEIWFAHGEKLLSWPGPVPKDPRNHTITAAAKMYFV